MADFDLDLRLKRIASKITKADLINIAVSQREDQLLTEKKELTKKIAIIRKEIEKDFTANDKQRQVNDKTINLLIKAFNKEIDVIIKKLVKSPKFQKAIDALKELGIKANISSEFDEYLIGTFITVEHGFTKNKIELGMENF